MKDFFFYYKKSYKEMFQFYGKVGRREYWSNVLVNTIIHIIFWTAGLIYYLLFKDHFTSHYYKASIIGWTLFLAYLFWFLSRIIPGISLTVRRLHDVGQPGWLYGLKILTPIFGGIVIFILTLGTSYQEKKTNQDKPKKRRRKNDNQVSKTLPPKKKKG